MQDVLLTRTLVGVVAKQCPVFSSYLIKYEFKANV